VDQTVKPTSAAASKKVPAVARAMAILKVLARHEQPMGVNAIARELGIFPSTCFHILRTLAEEQFVTLDPMTKQYRLGVGLLSVAGALLRKDATVKILQPELERLSRQHDLTTMLVQVASLERVVVVALHHSSQILRLNVEVGSSYPALISATGRCVAAFVSAPEEILKASFARLRWHAPPDFDGWLAEVGQTRAHGYGIDRENYIAGVTVIAAPIFDHHGAMTHALVAVGRSAEIERIGAGELGSTLAALGRRATSD
jgi:DNA-binding IclR family transcriptional regulator